MSTRSLIVNADDFGLSTGINEGVALAHEQGILTSASLMVRWPGANAAAAYALKHPALSVGLHLDLGEWTFVGEEWRIAYQVVPLEDPDAVSAEINRQFEQFHRLMRQEPTHMDSHQHVHETEPIRSLCLAAAEKRGIVLRNITPGVRYCGQFYGQSNKGYPYHEGISVRSLVQVISGLTECVTELGCHPACQPDMEGMYRTERVIECETLRHPAVREALATTGVQLRSFKNWRPTESRL